MSPVEGRNQAPRLARRLACFLYEGVLLFGVVMAVGLVYAIATRQSHALHGKLGLQASVFAVLGLYFVWFWSRHGQTLAMRTWRIRLVGPDGQPPRPGRAALRYLASWIWFLPALAGLYLTGLRGGLPATVTLMVGVCGYALLSRLHPGRQYWHDALCGTRLLDVDAEARRAT